MRGLVHPDNVSNIARARSASPRSREWANVSSALRCWSPAVTRDLPATPRRISARQLTPADFVGQADGVWLRTIAADDDVVLEIKLPSGAFKFMSEDF